MSLPAKTPSLTELLALMSGAVESEQDRIRLGRLALRLRELANRADDLSERMYREAGR